MTRSIICGIAIFLALIALIYGATAFTMWDADPGAWTSEARGIAAFIGGLLSLFVAVNAAVDLTKK